MFDSSIFVKTCGPWKGGAQLKWLTVVEFKDFSRLLRDFPVLFKADLIFKDFSRKPSKFKYFSSLCEPLVRLVFANWNFVLPS